MITIRQTLVAASAVIAVVFVTGCTTDNTGTPQPISSGEKSSETSTPPTSGSPFADVNACDLFDPVTSAQGFDASKEVKFESDNGCQARKPSVGTASMYLVDAGIDQLDTPEGTKSQGAVAGKDAVIISGFSGSSSCLIGIPITSKARATVSMTLSSGSNEQACESAKSIAEQIVPKLPQGS
ncbi:DUF3558 family protein [Amycolatopsis sp. lyj-112]|uniref:DUF3558 family protein n=1 Tax=Amycolatopsis sp. lyj-112 TaxID=2789288 RepID=UPI00397A34E0